MIRNWSTRPKFIGTFLKYITKQQIPCINVGSCHILIFIHLFAYIYDGNEDFPSRHNQGASRVPIKCIYFYFTSLGFICWHKQKRLLQWKEAKAKCQKIRISNLIFMHIYLQIAYGFKSIRNKLTKNLCIIKYTEIQHNYKLSISSVLILLYIALPICALCMGIVLVAQ